MTNCHLLKYGLRQIVTLFIFLIAGIVVHLDYNKQTINIMTYKINETVYSEGEYQQMQNMIRRYSVANLNEQNGAGTNSIYWKGVRDTYQAVLNETYGNDWAVQGSIGYYVFVLSQDYITAKESASCYWTANEKNLLTCHNVNNFIENRCTKIFYIAKNVVH